MNIGPSFPFDEKPYIEPVLGIERYIDNNMLLMLESIKQNKQYDSRNATLCLTSIPYLHSVFYSTVPFSHKYRVRVILDFTVYLLFKLENIVYPFSIMNQILIQF